MVLHGPLWGQGETSSSPVIRIGAHPDRAASRFMITVGLMNDILTYGGEPSIEPVEVPRRAWRPMSMWIVSAFKSSMGPPCHQRLCIWVCQGEVPHFVSWTASH